MKIRIFVLLIFSVLCSPFYGIDFPSEGYQGPYVANGGKTSIWGTSVDGGQSNPFEMQNGPMQAGEFYCEYCWDQAASLYSTTCTKGDVACLATDGDSSDFYNEYQTCLGEGHTECNSGDPALAPIPASIFPLLLMALLYGLYKYRKAKLAAC
jgi:hypothetical protein